MRLTIHHLAMPILLGLSLSISSVAFAAEPVVTEKEAVALIKKAQTLIKTKGEAALAEIEKQNTDLLKRETYIYIVNLDDGITTLHPKLKGKSALNLVDKNGKAFIQELIKVAKTGKPGWVDYWWANPVSKATEHKNAYVEKCVIPITSMDGQKHDTLIACGVYYEEKAEKK